MAPRSSSAKSQQSQWRVQILLFSSLSFLLVCPSSKRGSAVFSSTATTFVRVASASATLRLLLRLLLLRLLLLLALLLLLLPR